MKEIIENAIRLIRKDLERTLEYQPNSIGITSLLYCPLKVEYKKKYPELRSESLAIDDGFMFENMFIPYLEQAVIGKTIRREPTIYATIKNTTISGHPDLVIEDNEKITILEFKAPISIFPQNKDIELPEEEIIVDEDEIFKVSESYITQAKIQKKIAQLYYQKPVDSYLFIKSTADIKRKKKKLLILKPIKEEITEEELYGLIERFKNDKNPRYDWECNYCTFSKVCEVNNKN
jgi:hypothetical protein